jgi:hypothetical protein
MNDKDKEAFKEWYINKETLFENCLEAWQAACEYMRSKSNPLDALSLYVKLERERSENKKLREALEFYADKQNQIAPIYPYDGRNRPGADFTAPYRMDGGKKAREALKEVTTN